MLLTNIVDDMADTKRPPPLALKIDNTLPGYGSTWLRSLCEPTAHHFALLVKPPATARPLATRVYEANWRNLVITGAYSVTCDGLSMTSFSHRA